MRRQVLCVFYTASNFAVYPFLTLGTANEHLLCQTRDRTELDKIQSYLRSVETGAIP